MNPLVRLWTDRMDVYRWEDVLVAGVTKSRKELVYESLPCHYSKGSLVNTAEAGAPELKNAHKVFCSLDTDLQEGDEIIVTQRSGKKVTLSVGEGFAYTYQQEFSVKRDETA